MAFRFTIYDPTTDTTSTFPINPVEGALPSYERKVSSAATAAPDGQNLIFEGEPDPQTLPFTGSLLYEEHHTFWRELLTVKHQVLLTDDLGNQWWVIFTKFAPKRKNRHSHPWAATFDAEAMILDWPAA